MYSAPISIGETSSFRVSLQCRLVYENHINPADVEGMRNCLSSHWLAAQKGQLLWESPSLAVWFAEVA